MRVLSIAFASAIIVAAAPLAWAGDQGSSTAAPPASSASTAKPATPPATPAQPSPQPSPEPSNVVKTKTKSNQSND
jgi:hypothetical protein